MAEFVARATGDDAGRDLIRFYRDGVPWVQLTVRSTDSRGEGGGRFVQLPESAFRQIVHEYAE